MATMRNAGEIEDLLVGLFTGEVGPEDLDEAIDAAEVRVETFADAELLTRDRGIVLRLANGAEFQMTIVKSARGDGPECCECGEEFGDRWDLIGHLIATHGWDDDDALAECGLR